MHQFAKAGGFPLVSVVIRVYNQENFIEQALNSIFSQNYKGEIELIIADDHSTDHTPVLIKKRLENIPDGFQINYTRHDKNKGMVGNLLWGLQQAKGKYIALCDADDFWTDSLKIQKQIDFFQENPNCWMIGHAYKEVLLEQNKSSIKQKIKTRGVCTLTDFLEGRGFRAAAPTMLFRKEVVPKVVEWLQKDIAIDDLALYMISGHYGDFGYLPEVMATAERESSEEAWSSKTNNSEGILQYLFDKDTFYSYFNDLTDGVYQQSLYQSRYRTINRHIIDLQNRGVSKKTQWKLLKPHWKEFLKPTKSNLFIFYNMFLG